MPSKAYFGLASLTIFLYIALAPGFKTLAIDGIELKTEPGSYSAAFTQADATPTPAPGPGSTPTALTREPDRKPSLLAGAGLIVAIVLMGVLIHSRRRAVE